MADLGLAGWIFEGLVARGRRPVALGACIAGATALAITFGASLPSEIGTTPTEPLDLAVGSVVRLQKGTCLPEVETWPLATAVVELEIFAPCDIGQSVEVDHDGIRIAAIVDDRGRAIMTLPALRPSPTYTVTVTGRDAVRVEGAPLDFDGYRRAVLLAGPDTGLELHAYEGDAAFGDTGHVWPDQPYDPVRALVGDGGFLSRIGTPGLAGTPVAQVYTVPARTEVAVSLEAMVTEMNCGRDIEALTIHPSADGPPVTTPWRVSMPGCDAVGEIVVLGDLGR